MHNNELATLLAAPSWWQVQQSEIIEPETSLPNQSDLVVVGGGITGLSAALSALKNGFSVTLLEGASIGTGATGRNSGFIVPVPGRHTPASLQQHLGMQTQPYLAVLSNSAQTLLAFSKARGNSSGWILPYGQADKSKVQTTIHDWMTLGVQADYLDGEQLSIRLGTDIYTCAIDFCQGGQVDPFALAQAMVDECHHLGGTVITHCPALKFIRTPQGSYRVQTPQGEIAAYRLLVAGNCYGDGPCKTYQSTGATMVMILAVFELSPEDAVRCLPQGVPFSDSYKDMWFFRRVEDNRLMTGMFALPGQNQITDCERILQQRITTTFNVASSTLLHMWAGRIGLTHHALPYLHCPDDALAYWTGCNGRGLALSHALGSNLALRLLQRKALILPQSRAWALPAATAMRWLAQLLVARDRRRRTIFLPEY